MLLPHLNGPEVLKRYSAWEKEQGMVESMLVLGLSGNYAPNDKLVRMCCVVVVWLLLWLWWGCGVVVCVCCDCCVFVAVVVVVWSWGKWWW